MHDAHAAPPSDEPASPPWLPLLGLFLLVLGAGYVLAPSDGVAKSGVDAAKSPPAPSAQLEAKAKPTTPPPPTGAPAGTGSMRLRVPPPRAVEQMRPGAPPGRGAPPPGHGAHDGHGH